MRALTKTEIVGAITGSQANFSAPKRPEPQMIAGERRKNCAFYRKPDDMPVSHLGNCKDHIGASSGNLSLQGIDFSRMNKSALETMSTDVE